MLLPVQWQAQQDERWCWATVASIVAIYYATQLGEGPPLMPCQVATACLPGGPCCPPDPSTDPPPPACRTTFDLRRALDAVGHLSRELPQQTGFDLVQFEIGNNRPLCAMIRFVAGPFHYVLIGGFDIPSGQVMILDPATKAYPMPYTTFLANNNFTFMQWILTS